MRHNFYWQCIKKLRPSNNSDCVKMASIEVSSVLLLLLRPAPGHVRWWFQHSCWVLVIVFLVCLVVVVVEVGEEVEGVELATQLSVSYPSLSREPSPSDSTEGAPDIGPRRGLGDVFLLLELEPFELPPPLLVGPAALLLLLEPKLAETALAFGPLLSVPLASLPNSSPPKPSLLLKLLLCLTK